MRLIRLRITSTFKNLKGLQIDFQDKNGITVLIGNNGSGKSNILEAISAIFRGLFDRGFNPSFSYNFIYDLNGKEIKIVYKTTTDELRVKVDNEEDRLRNEFLPNQVICCYSGEEDRIWTEYYKPVYVDYVKALRGNEIPELPLIFVNKYYWDIALLTFFFHDFEIFEDLKDFCEDTLGISSIDEISFDFNNRLLKDWPTNPVVNFVSTINPDGKEQESYTIDKLKEVLGDLISSEIDFFKYLMAATMPKEDKLIKSVRLSFNNGQTVKSLSEGEKKLILIQLILEVLGDENSLILFDEPDSHVHISRKKELKNIFSGYANRENILTTHSPTLTHSFDISNIAMLEKNESDEARIGDDEKLKVIEKLTDGIWSYQEQNFFLNSSKDLILVEGKTDIAYLAAALRVLKDNYPEFVDLEFEYLPFGGASGLELFVDKFQPKPDQTIIAFLDRDQAGHNALKNVMGFEGTLDEYQTTEKNGISIALYPKPTGYNKSQLVAEDYFGIDFLRALTWEEIESYTEVKSAKALKKEIERRCIEGSIDQDKLTGFKVVFDEILHIMN
jgi:predicted ATP-dependent endonuclease of OLD family